MNKPYLSRYITLLLMVTVFPVYAGDPAALRSPQSGVLCDSHFCASNEGISRELTEKNLGEKVAIKLFSQGDFNLTEFTFANGIFCDVKDRLCREDQYYGIDGRHSGVVSEKYTKLLFGQ